MADQHSGQRGAEPTETVAGLDQVATAKHSGFENLQTDLIGRSLAPERCSTTHSSRHAVLNHPDAIHESEATIGALAVGLDPYIGIFHADRGFHKAFAADLMESVRPQAPYPRHCTSPPRTLTLTSGGAARPAKTDSAQMPPLGRSGG